MYDGDKMKETPFFQPKCAAHPGTHEWIFVGDIVETPSGLCKISSFFIREECLHVRSQRIVPCSNVLSPQQLTDLSLEVSSSLVFDFPRSYQSIFMQGLLLPVPERIEIRLDFTTSTDADLLPLAPWHIVSSKLEPLVPFNILSLILSRSQQIFFFFFFFSLLSFL